jgi:SAM-dependent methyltransferase
MGFRLAADAEYLGVELDSASWTVAHQTIERAGRGEVLRGTLDVVPKDRFFDMVCAFEVLEHVEDDLGLLRQCRTHLRDGGWLLLSVPAHQSQFGPSDEAVGHLRRYERADLLRLVRKAGFECLDVSAVGFPLGLVLQSARNRLAPARVVEESTQARTEGSGRLFQPSARSTGLALAALGVPFRLAQMPFRTTDLCSGYVLLARSSHG